MGGIDIPILRSSRLTLRRFYAADHPHLLALASDPEVMRHMQEGPPPSPGEVWQRISVALGQWGLRGYGMMAAEDKDGFVGRVGFWHPYQQPEPLLVYALAKHAWGRGYATEAVGLICEWMFARHRLPRLLSHIAPENAASARVAFKLGATRQGTSVSNGVVLDVWCYAAPG
jgi:RimJ/RimL family protein N-acetyltransferase